jgi:hypothetical protein
MCRARRGMAKGAPARPSVLYFTILPHDNRTIQYFTILYNRPFWVQTIDFRCWWFWFLVTPNSPTLMGSKKAVVHGYQAKTGRTHPTWIDKQGISRAWGCMTSIYINRMDVQQSLLGFSWEAMAYTPHQWWFWLSPRLARMQTNISVETQTLGIAVVCNYDMEATDSFYD